MARSVTPTSGVIGVSVAGLQDLAEKLRVVSAASAETMTQTLQDAGELVAVEARTRSSYSTKIPASIHTDVAGPGLVRVSTQLTEAVAIENRGRGYVRHPLFGTRTHWYSNPQPAFLLPSLIEKREEFREVAIAAIHEAFEEAGMGK